MRQAGLTIPIHLTQEQERLARRCVGASRFAYNWAVDEFRATLDAVGEWLTAPRALQYRFNAIKDTLCPWVRELPYWVSMGGVHTAQQAHANWLNKAHPARRPRRRKKKHYVGTGSFTIAVSPQQIHYDGHKRVKLHRAFGSVKLSRKLPGDAVLKRAVISQRNGRWWISFATERPDAIPEDRETQVVGGVDVGIEPLAMDSDGVSYENPKAYARMIRKRRCWQRRLGCNRAPTDSRCKCPRTHLTPGSRGWWEARHRLDSIERRIKGLRGNAHHQASRQLVRKYSVLGIETLNVKGMDKLRWQAKAIRDAAIGGLLEKIKYKAAWYGTELAPADRWYASSKTCADCGSHNSELRRELQ